MLAAPVLRIVGQPVRGDEKWEESVARRVGAMAVARRAEEEGEVRHAAAGDQE